MKKERGNLAGQYMCKVIMSRLKKATIKNNENSHENAKHTCSEYVLAYLIKQFVRFRLNQSPNKNNMLLS